VLIIDEDKCKRDGLCVAVCPVGIIERKEEEAIPTPIDGFDQLCIRCGHCVAICPHAALTLGAMRPSDCPPVRKEFILGAEQAEHFLRYRRSIRNYKDEAVDRDALVRLIEMARFAPSGHNLQPVHWLVFEARADLQRLGALVIDWMRFMIGNQPEIAGAMHFDRVVAAWELGQDRVLRGAPHLIVAHGSQAFTATQPACIIALTYLELAATALGLGACWAGYFNAAATWYPPMKEALDLPEGHASFGAMMVGYPKYHYHRLPVRNEPTITWRP
jgi:nitroreductase/Pyruvate/2-oxoacid:ferredoxin oxidoreductase delta subunit